MRVSLLSYAIYFAAVVSEVEVLICNARASYHPNNNHSRRTMQYAYALQSSNTYCMHACKPTFCIVDRCFSALY